MPSIHENKFLQGRRILIRQTMQKKIERGIILREEIACQVNWNRKLHSVQPSGQTFSFPFPVPSEKQGSRSAIWSMKWFRDSEEGTQSKESKHMSLRSQSIWVFFLGLFIYFFRSKAWLLNFKISTKGGIWRLDSAENWISDGDDLKKVPIN